MNNLTYSNLKNIWDGQKNLIGKPILINFYKTNIEQELKLSEIFEVRGIPHFIMISKDGGISPGGGALNKETLKYFLEGLL